MVNIYMFLFCLGGCVTSGSKDSFGRVQFQVVIWEPQFFGHTRNSSALPSNSCSERGVRLALWFWEGKGTD